MIIGLTGTNGSGKDALADYLKEKGFSYHSLSDIIRDELRKKNLELTREHHIKQGNDLRKTFGPGILGKKVADKIRKSGNKDSVVVSIRNLNELQELRKLPEFHFIFVDAPVKMRYERTVKRASQRDKENFEEFKQKEEIEMKGTVDHVQQLGLCKKKADKIIINDGTLEQLYKQIEQFLSKITKE